MSLGVVLLPPEPAPAQLIARLLREAAAKFESNEYTPLPASPSYVRVDLYRSDDWLNWTFDVEVRA